MQEQDNSDALRPIEQVLAVYDSESMQGTLQAFRQLSRQLSDTYAQMEIKFKQLNGQLIEASQQHLQEFAEKERLTNRLDNLLEMLPAGVLLLDQNGFIRQSNTAAEALLLALTGAKTLQGLRWRHVIQRCFRPQQDDGHEISLVNGRRVHIDTAPMSGEPGQLVLLTDMTETRQLQAQLSQHERLSAMGKMVASLAHQIRTPLSAATLYAGHLGNPDLEEHLRVRFAGKLQERLRHLESQIRDMLIFARGETPLNDELSLSELQEDLEAAMEVAVQNQGAVCVIENEAPASRLICNRDALVGALMNLINNALEASPLGNAKLSIVLKVLESSHVTIVIVDNGPGMTDEQLEKIKQPFFTTKTNGTGLGLAVVQAVARAHKAEFILANHPQGGLLAGMNLPLRDNI